MLKTYEDKRTFAYSSCDCHSTKPADLESDTDVTEAPVKLNNSEIPQNIQTKLIHLKQSERDDIDHLLQDYKELFSDVHRERPRSVMT